MDVLLQSLKSNKYMYDGFLSAVLKYFSEHPDLNQRPLPNIHSIKSRIKDDDHIVEKIERKQQKGIVVTTENIFEQITDYIGVRILHLHQQQFVAIHTSIMSNQDWKLKELPKAMTWDPESKAFYERLGITTEQRETYYTSVHYVIQPNNENAIVSCEIQVRTLFEEIWGEIDHAINYPCKTSHTPTAEQLKVLSKLAATGTKLVDSIFVTHQEFLERTNGERQPVV
jgi:ppGpp synthetase/RelA/SpoT-type nucleotidyltranferase